MPLVFRYFLFFALISSTAGVATAVPAKELGLEFELQAGDRGLVRDEPVLRDATGRTMSLSRLDFLVSELALQREDGTWMESRDWYMLVSAGMGRTRAAATGVPAERYQAIRFSIGVEPTVNAGDPNQWEPGHPLHPQTAGLHWGWQGGYIFMAAEGHWQQSGKANAGWSWHLATDAMRTTVELPVKLDAGTARLVRIAFDVSRLTSAIDLEKDGATTHSRPGDPLAAKLKSALAVAFRIAGTGNDRYQDTAAEVTTTSASHGTPLPLKISARLPRVRIPADNRPTAEGVELGRLLFHETALSADKSVSCATCHQQAAAFADAGKAVSTGVGGSKGSRNAMPLFNLAWHDEYFWDGRVRGLRHQVLHPIADPAEMQQNPDEAAQWLAATADYPQRFARAFGDAAVTKERLGLALEQYLLTLISQDSRFDRAARGEEKLTSEEQRGLELFVTEYDPARGLRGADCFHCHGGNLFTNGQFASNGLDAVSEDSGRQKVTTSPADAGRFRVPSLRNVAVTGPYMHDGRFATLEEVIAHYDHGVKRSASLDPNLAKHPEAGLGLSAADQKALVAFLRSLTDESFTGSTPAISRQ